MNYWYNQSPGMGTGTALNRCVCGECGASVSMVYFDAQTESRSRLHPCQHEATLRFVSI